MISKISVSTYTKTPSFGLAKFSREGYGMIRDLRMNSNTFMNEDCFQRQGFFQDAAISHELEAGNSFEDICTNYGCTQYADKNASFIRHQILSKKGVEGTSKVSKDEKLEGLKTLYLHNFDNPCLSFKETRALLDRIGKGASADFYFKNIGLLEKGTIKK